MSLDYTVQQLPDVWPGKATPSHARKRPLFKTIWTKALDLLDREIFMLGGKNVRIAVDVDFGQIRQDGQLYANARLRSPAVIVIFDTRDGTLQFPCDTFTYWQKNVDAIARALEALRLVNRYGVQHGKQYAGFKAIPPSTAPTCTPDSAARFIADLLGMVPETLLRHRSDAQLALRRAAAKTHPDAGGSADAFARVQMAKRVLEAHHGGAL